MINQFFNMSNEWTEHDTEKLIILYGQYQCLWNPFHSESDDKVARYKAYKEIKNSMNVHGLTVCDCIERITNLKKEYCYEMSKITAAIFYEKLYTPKARWFKRMHELLFPYISTFRYANFIKQNNEHKFNDSGIRGNLLHLSFKESEDKQICSNDTYGPCKPREIALHLKLRKPIHSASKVQDTFFPSETIKRIDIGVETSNDIMERKGYFTQANEEKKDCSTCMDDNFVEMFDERKIEDNFDIFGKSVAFQLRTIDTQTVAQVKKEIQNLITKARLKTCESKLINHKSAFLCCCDCSDCKIMCKDKTCNCDLLLEGCLLLMKIKKESKA